MPTAAVPGNDSNLLDNAIKYTPSAGSIEIDIEPAASQVLLNVSDDGPGVPAGDRERIEKRFVRLDAARTEPGNGRGLALVRAVVDQHHGTLSSGDARPQLQVRIGLPLPPG